MNPFAEYDIFSLRFSGFVFLNWFLTLVSASFLGVLVYRYKWLVIKPTFFLLICVHFFFQWPTTLFAIVIEHVLSQPLVLPLLVHTFVLLGILVACMTNTESTATVWSRIERYQTSNLNELAWPTKILGLMMLASMASYFCYVPISSTGLYALFVTPKNADVARDLSYNNLPGWMKYIFSIMETTVVPVLASVLTVRALDAYNNKSYRRLINLTGFLVLSLVAVSITGARYSVVKALLTVIVSGLLWRQLKVSWFAAITAVLFVLLPAALITLTREGQSATISSVLYYLFYGIIVHRILTVPLLVGIWHLQYVELNSFFGIGAVPKIAQLVGIPPLYVPAIIGQHFLPNPNFATHSDASFIITYYSYFGLIAIPLCLFLLLMLDVLASLYEQLRTPFLIPCVAATSLAILELIQSDFTTVMISHGLLLIPLLVYFLDYCSRPSTVPVDFVESNMPS